MDKTSTQDQLITLGGGVCLGEHYGKLHGSGGVLVIVAFVIIKCFFAFLTVVIKLIALIARPVLGHISTEF